MLLSVSEIAELLNVPFAGKDAFIKKGAIDNRGDVKDSIFVCIPGTRVDGHDYAANAVENGAAAVLALKDMLLGQTPVLKSSDTINDLGKIAEYWREKAKSKVVCLTGTAGKTTLKDTLGSILSLAGKVAITDKNHNNQIGMPLTILDTTGDEDFWVLEAGISHIGDMDILGAIARPDLAIILNVGPGHTEGLAEKGVAWHKTRLLRYLSPGGQAVVSADYPEIVSECEKLGINPHFFSNHDDKKTPFRVLDEKEPGCYTLLLGDNDCDVLTPFNGVWGAEISIAAACAASILGVGIDIIQKGFKKLKLPEQRFNQFKYHNWHIFDDTYNANPLSMRRMLATVADFAERQHLSLYMVLGEMGELGEEAEKWHYQTGIWLGEINPRIVYWKGSFLDNIKQGYEKINEHKKGKLTEFIETQSTKNFASALIKHKQEINNGGVIIFKGSRFNHLEEFLKEFLKIFGKPNVL